MFNYFAKRAKLQKKIPAAPQPGGQVPAARQQGGRGIFL